MHRHIHAGTNLKKLQMDTSRAIFAVKYAHWLGRFQLVSLVLAPPVIFVCNHR